ncbi:MAG: hypothetical protein ACRDXE_01350, partial [Acidimicrobiales bacterium]
MTLGDRLEDEAIPHPAERAPATRAPVAGRAQWAGVAAVLVVAVIFPQLYGGDQYTMSIATQCVEYALITISRNLL